MIIFQDKCIFCRDKRGNYYPAVELNLSITSSLHKWEIVVKKKQTNVKLTFGTEKNEMIL